MLKKKRNKFSASDRLSAVKLVLEEGLTYHEVGKRLCTSYRLVSLWTDSYKKHGIDGLSKKPRVKHTADFKLRVVHKILSDQLSLQEASTDLQITMSSLSKWLREYQESGALSLSTNKQLGRPRKMKLDEPIKTEEQTDLNKELLEELEYLRAENAYLKKVKALVQERVVRKTKSGQKPSKN